MIKLIECPRDAWQGIGEFIPTPQKINYLNQLLSVGFDTLDFGSFVNPKVMPQMKDTHEVVTEMNWGQSDTSLLAIVANLRGAEEAVKYPQVRYLGFPLSLSETFQQRNTNKSISEALETVRAIHELTKDREAEPVIYLSMGFGNPYGDPFNTEVVHEFTHKMSDIGIKILSLADTIGVATPEMIHELYSSLIPDYPQIEFGAHLHSNPASAEEKLWAAYKAGCRRFDGAIRGFGGCPMVDDELVGNIQTELMIRLFRDELESIDEDAFGKAMGMSSEIFH